MKNQHLKAHETYLKRLLMNREEFLVIGLTGRVGSGCSEAAHVFSQSFSELNLPCIFPGMHSLSENDQDLRTLYQYAKSHWLKFDVIQVRAIITSYLMKDIGSFFKYVNDKSGFIPNEQYPVETLPTEYQRIPMSNNAVGSSESQTLPRTADHTDALESKVATQILHNLQERAAVSETWEESHFLDHDISEKFREAEPHITELIQQISTAESWQNLKSALTDSSLQNLDSISSVFSQKYGEASNPEKYHLRNDNLHICDSALNHLSALLAWYWWDKALNLKNIPISEVMSNIVNYLDEHIPMDKMSFACYVFVHDIIPAVSDAIHQNMRDINPTFFTELFQMLGNSLRRTGKIFYNVQEMEEQLKKAPEDIFVIPRRINHFIKVLRHPFCRKDSRPTRVVIDSIKNIFEATYLRERYSAFYLYAISADEEIRISRLMDSGGKNMNLRDIQQIGWKEYADKGKAIYSRGQKKPDSLSDEEMEFYNNLRNPSHNKIHHAVDNLIRQDAYEHNLFPFVLQNVGVSIENADVFITNNHDRAKPNMTLRWEIVRNVCLTMYPGLLLPTPVERCMQIAFAAKVNSGCLSRQVGAVVTDSDYHILSLGWNDVPCGDVSCIRKNLTDLAMHQDQDSYSHYELYDPEFRNRLDQLIPDPRGAYRESLSGLTLRYCFKDLHMDGRNPMRSRAMHAEEKALADVSNCIGGYLFTTSSPCEMCSKNAKNHRIKRIYYIESYPGISESQYTLSGSKGNRAEHILFTGAIGRAYSQMYTPIMPHKDILELLGIDLKLSK